jgi:hypothetical protein
MDATMSRPAVRDAVECPECTAKGQRCTGVRGRTRESNHLGRVRAAEVAGLHADPDDLNWNDHIASGRAGS